MDATAETKNKEYDQPCLSFDFIIEEEKAKQRKEAEYKEMLKGLPYFDKPKTDNERLFNLQFEYYNGKPERINDIFIQLYTIAPKLVHKEATLRKIKLSQEIINDYASESVMFFISQIKKNNLIIKTSFIAYLRLQVLKSMFNATLAIKFERWCVQNHIDFIHLDTYAQQKLKKQFEEKFGIKRKEKKNGNKDTEENQKNLFEWTDYRTPEMG